MASPNSTFTEVVTTTLRKRPNFFTDNMKNHNALYRKMEQKGNIRRINSGRSIVENLEYAENGTFQYFSGYETIDISASDVLSAAEYDWKQASVAVTSSGLEIRNNSASPERVVDLVKSRLNVAKKTMMNKLSIGMYSDGTGSGGKQIGGLQALVSDSGTGTVGGINSSTFTFWQNKVRDASAASITPSKSTIIQLMLPLYLDLTEGSDVPDLIVADKTYFSYYEESLTDLQRYTSENDAQAGFVTLKYRGSDVVYDSNASGMPDNHMYFLNTDYLKFVMHSQADIRAMETRMATNQDAEVVPILFQGNMTLSNRRLQGVLID